MWFFLLVQSDDGEKFSPTLRCHTMTEYAYESKNIDVGFFLFGGLDENE